MRMKARRNARRRPAPRWARRTARAGAAAALAAVALGGAAWLWQSGRVEVAAGRTFDALAAQMAGAGVRVENVFLEGRRHESSNSVAAALAVPRGTPMFGIDLEAARRRLEKLPWVRSAGVERRFPDTVRVTIVERRPLALWQRRNELVLVDDRGEVIPQEDLERFPGLLVVVGKDAPAHVGALLRILSNEPTLKKRVNAAVRVGARRWNLRMDNGVYVWLPERGALDAWNRLARFERLHGLLEQDLQSIDLRLPDQLIVRTRGSAKGKKT